MVNIPMYRKKDAILPFLDAKTIISKTFNFMLHLAQESKDLESFMKDLQDYKTKMEKQEYLSILEEFEKL